MCFGCSGSGEPAAPRPQSLLRSCPRCALLSGRAPAKGASHGPERRSATVRARANLWCDVSGMSVCRLEGFRASLASGNAWSAKRVRVGAARCVLLIAIRLGRRGPAPARCSARTSLRTHSRGRPPRGALRRGTCSPPPEALTAGSSLSSGVASLNRGSVSKGLNLFICERSSQTRVPKRWPDAKKRSAALGRAKHPSRGVAPEVSAQRGTSGATNGGGGPQAPPNRIRD